MPLYNKVAYAQRQGYACYLLEDTAFGRAQAALPKERRVASPDFVKIPVLQRCLEVGVLRNQLLLVHTVWLNVYSVPVQRYNTMTLGTWPVLVH